MNSSLKNTLKETSRLREEDISQIEISKSSYSHSVLKRVFDLFCALTVLVVELPILPLLALIIKIDSKGPIFVAQSRVGLNGRKFSYFKFRTMVTDQPAEEHYESAEKQFISFDDRRLTRMGRFLRKSYLDEIPALFNVLKGDVSIVGRTRILDYPDIAANLKPEIKTALLGIKPGLTSLWAVSYDRMKADEEYIVSYDLFYLRKRSRRFW